MLKIYNHQKHYAERVIPDTGEVVQLRNSDIIPKFITGKDKEGFIVADYMYSKMYDLYKRKISSGSDLLIVGYSYRDEHMNDELKKFTKTDGPKIINLNYGDKFPFEYLSVTEITNFTQLA